MHAPPHKAKAPSDCGAQGLQVETFENPDSATGTPSWEYRVTEVRGRFLVISPLGIAIEDCPTMASAVCLAARLNGNRGGEARQ